MPASPADSASLKLTRHPPERHRRGDVTLCCGCTCCCCCCLHTVGAIAGAAIAPNVGYGFVSDEDDPAGGALYGISGPMLFWCVTAVLSIAGVVLFATLGHTNMFLSLIGLAMVLPGVMLAGGIVAIFILVMTGRPDRFREMKIVAKAIAGTVLGGCLGIAVMAGIWGLFGGFR